MSNIYYMNTRNEKVDFIDDFTLLDIDNLFETNFSSVCENNIISEYETVIRNYTLKGDAPVEYMDEYTDIFDYDIYNNKRGKLYIGDYYMMCNIVASSPAKVNLTRSFLTTTLTVTTDKPWWQKESITTINPGTYSEGFKYPFTYSFMYGDTSGLGSVYNEAIAPSEFKLILYGACTNPSVSIGENTYCIYASLDKGERIEIDSLERACTLIDLYGHRTDVFNLRDFRYSIYDKIPSGYSTILYSGTFGIDLYIYEQRSKPRWIS